VVVSRRGTLFEALKSGKAETLKGCSGSASADMVAGFAVLVMVIVFAVLLSGCAQMGQAYATYDSSFERELVAGHDSLRGDYVEYRVKPRPRENAETLKAERLKADGKAVAR
jgi:hypothetical protein